MSVCAKVKRYLDKHRVSYNLLSHKPTVTLQEAADILKVPAEQVARTVVMADREGVCIAVLPLSEKIDFVRLNYMMQRNLKIVPRKVADRLFCDCEAGSHPPFGQAYGVVTIVDRKLKQLPYLYFEPGTHTAFIQMSQNEFHYLMSNATWGNFSVSMAEENVLGAKWIPQPELVDELVRYHAPNIDALGKKLLTTYRVPPLPKRAQAVKDWRQAQGPAQLGVLVHDSSALLAIARCIAHRDIQSIESLEAHDPLLSLMQYNYIAYWCIRRFKINIQGPLSIAGLASQALLSALMMHDLVKAFGKDSDLLPNLAYMSGLSQNAGYLLMGHIFKPEYQMLNKMLLFNPHTPVRSLEKRIIGMGQAKAIMQSGHAQLGAWLLRHWEMPEALVEIISEHENIGYTGEYAPYTSLLRLTNALLRSSGIGEGNAKADVKQAYELLDIDPMGLHDWYDAWIKVHQPIVEGLLRALDLLVSE